MKRLTTLSIAIILVGLASCEGVNFQQRQLSDGWYLVEYSDEDAFEALAGLDQHVATICPQGYESRNQRVIQGDMIFVTYGSVTFPVSEDSRAIAEIRCN